MLFDIKSLRGVFLLVLEVVSFYTKCESFQENYLEVFVPTQRSIPNSFAIVALALFFVLSGVESLIFVSDSGLIATAEARGKDKGKDKDKDKDDDTDFVFNEDNFTTTVNCQSKKIKAVRVDYHEDFASTENATGPNILIEGADNNDCVITIEKISGGNECGYRVFLEEKVWDVGPKQKPKFKILRVKTKPKDNAKNCEMCIKLTVPRWMKIGANFQN